MKSRFSTALTLMTAFVAVSLVLSGCGRTRGDDTVSEPVLVFNELVTVGDL